MLPLVLILYDLMVQLGRLTPRFVRQGLPFSILKGPIFWKGTQVPAKEEEKKPLLFMQISSFLEGNLGRSKEEGKKAIVFQTPAAYARCGQLSEKKDAWKEWLSSPESLAN